MGGNSFRKSGRDVSRNNGPRGEKSAIAAKKGERREGGREKKERKKGRKERGKRAAERMADNAEMQDGETTGA